MASETSSLVAGVYVANVLAVSDGIIVSAVALLLACLPWKGGTDTGNFSFRELSALASFFLSSDPGRKSCYNT